MEVCKPRYDNFKDLTVQLLITTGLNLLSLSLDESTTISNRHAAESTSFSRQLYLHSITYLLRGLPSDLTAAEQLGIRSSLPPNLVTVEPELDCSKCPRSTTVAPTKPSILHRTLANLIIQTCILFQLFLPYLKALLSAAYTYDREHKVSAKLMVHGFETVDKVSRGSWTVGGKVLELGDGKLGQYFGESAKWFVEGVVGGVNEGLGEGLLILSSGNGAQN